MLRDYQEKAIELIREEFKKGNKKVLLRAATGSGKTTIFSYMIKEAAKKNMHAMVVVRGRKLVDQASQRIAREGVNHGVFMSGHWGYKPHLPIQVASVDTLISRGTAPKADLIIIDEVHLAASKGYKELISRYPQAFIVGCTATPYVEAGLTHVADCIVHPITMDELIGRGYLVPFKYFAPSTPDVSRVKISSSTKDYVSKDLADVMIKQNGLTGNIVEHWKKHANDMPTLCFCVNIAHSKFLVEKFNNHGISAEHCDADSTDEERNGAIRRLQSGETKIVCNVGIFGTGVDIPFLRAIIFARPTKSKNLFIQQAGRGTRTSIGKENCVLLDHAGNIMRHGFPTDEPEVDLNGREKLEKADNPKTCKECFCVYKGSVCPECGAKPEPKKQESKTGESEDNLIEIDALKIDPVKKYFMKLLDEARQTNKKTSWCYYKMIDKFGFAAACPHIPRWFRIWYLRNQQSVQPSTQALEYLSRNRV